MIVSPLAVALSVFNRSLIFTFGEIKNHHLIRSKGCSNLADKKLGNSIEFLNQR